MGSRNHRQRKKKPSFMPEQWVFIAMSFVFASVSLQYLHSPKNLPCDFVMAESSLTNGGWGVFTLKEMEKGEEILFGSPFLVMSDIMEENLQHPGLEHIHRSYIWDGSAILGHFEANLSHAFGPGIPALANSHSSSAFVNVQPQTKTSLQKHGGNNGASRNLSPIAGSSSSYQNYGDQAGKLIEAGSELIIPYGNKWSDKLYRLNQNVPQPQQFGKPVEWLAKHGRCLDLIRPIEVGERGYGITVTRPMKKGYRLTSVPLLPLHRSNLSMKRAPFQQMALNYVFGQSGSSLLLLPYGPTFSLINHSNEPNAKLEWDEVSHAWTSASVYEVLNRRPTGGSLLANLVATKDLSEGEEIFIDYGPKWQRAWEDHVAVFKTTNEEHVYANEFNMDPKNRILRDQKEQEEFPYPKHLMPICGADPKWPVTSKQKVGDRLTTKVDWGIVSRMVLFPCKILERSTVAYEQRYVVELSELDRGPAGNLKHGGQLDSNETRIVTNVPRKAITFVDRPYESDLHLPNGFRHEMQSLPFPSNWLD